jgi:hypothetical protein
MAYDANAVLQASVIKTATFNGAGYDLKTGTPVTGLVARVVYSAASNAAGSTTVTFSIDHSDDNSTFYALSSAASDVVTLSTTVQTGELFIPFRTSKRYVRLTVTVTGGTTPTITYYSEIGLSKP